MIRYYLSLGSNLGEREKTLRKAVQLIEQQIGKVPCCSSYFYSDPWGFESENGFCNICCLLETELQPIEVLRATQAIEKQLGRTHKTIDAHYSDRIIDIDLIQAFDQNGQEIKCQISNFKSSNPQIFQYQKSEALPSLILPHPLWQQREFVKQPLSELKNSLSLKDN